MSTRLDDPFENGAHQPGELDDAGWHRAGLIERDKILNQLLTAALTCCITYVVQEATRDLIRFRREILCCIALELHRK